VLVNKIALDVPTKELGSFFKGGKRLQGVGNANCEIELKLGNSIRERRKVVKKSRSSPFVEWARATFELKTRWQQTRPVVAIDERPLAGQMPTGSAAN
jgi:hypothetical protein